MTKGRTHRGGWLLCSEPICFACGKAFSISSTHVHVFTSDRQMVCVGLNCGTHIRHSGAAGYQPPMGGPKLYLEKPE